MLAEVTVTTANIPRMAGAPASPENHKIIPRTTNEKATRQSKKYCPTEGFFAVVSSGFCTRTNLHHEYVDMHFCPPYGAAPLDRVPY